MQAQSNPPFAINSAVNSQQYGFHTQRGACFTETTFQGAQCCAMVGTDCEMQGISSAQLQRVITRESDRSAELQARW
jgi:hypothetical protein